MVLTVALKVTVLVAPSLLGSITVCVACNVRLAAWDESAKIAKEVADEFTAKEPHKPRFVAGSMGPTNRTASMSPDVNDPGFRTHTFDQVVDSYYEQVRGLMDGGVDLILTVINNIMLWQRS